MISFIISLIEDAMADNSAEYVRPLIAIAAGGLFILFGIMVWDADGWIAIVPGIFFVGYGIIKIMGIRGSLPQLAKQYHSIINLPLPEKFSYILNKAKDGDKEAQYHLGMMYRLSIGTVENLDESSKWLDNSAQQGYAPAQYEMGNLYKAVVPMPNFDDDKDFDDFFNHTLGNPSAKHVPEAVKWYGKAAAQGCWKSCLELSNLFFDEDPAKSKEWLDKGLDLLYFAAIRDDSEAQTRLGLIALAEKYNSNSFAQAKIWFRKAIERRSPDPLAMFHLGSMYENGQGMPKDRVQAFDCYVKAVEYGGKSMLYQFSFLRRLEVRLRLLFN